MSKTNKMDNNNYFTIGLIRAVYRHLTTRRRRQLAGISMLMIVCSFLEAISIGSMVPFLSVMTSPETVAEMKIIRPVLAFLGINDIHGMRLSFLFLFLALILVTGCLRILSYWVQARLSMSIGVDLSVQVYENTLYQPYGELIQRNSSEILAGAHKAKDLVGYIIHPTLTFINSFFMLSAVLTALILVEPIIAISSVLGFGLLYILAVRTSKRSLRENSKIYATELGRVNKAIQEGVGGIRDIIIDGTQATLTSVYRNSISRMQYAAAGNVLAAQLPRFLIEMLGLVILAVVTLLIVSRDENIIDAIPILGAIALGAQRLLPVLQQGYAAYVTIRGGVDSINDALVLLNHSVVLTGGHGATVPLTFNNGVVLDGISFRYTPESKLVLSDISIDIKCGSRIGLIGTTGSGKSTLVDLIMGLLQPTKGLLYVDGVKLCSSNMRCWHSFISHVPQSIYLADATVAQNIAFGIEPKKIDMVRLKQATQIAQLTETINGLDLGYETFVGERGVRLSGGQIQRMGIARAIYKNPSILILDEATSALDEGTEKKILKGIEQLDKKITIIAIAHRLKSLDNYDVIYRVENGTLIWRGTYNELGGNSSH